MPNELGLGELGGFSSAPRERERARSGALGPAIPLSMRKQALRGMTAREIALAPPGRFDARLAVATLLPGVSLALCSCGIVR